MASFREQSSVAVCLDISYIQKYNSKCDYAVRILVKNYAERNFYSASGHCAITRLRFHRCLPCRERYGKWDKTRDKRSLCPASDFEDVRERVFPPRRRAALPVKYTYSWISRARGVMLRISFPRHVVRVPSRGFFRWMFIFSLGSSTISVSLCFVCLALLFGLCRFRKCNENAVFD